MTGFEIETHKESQVPESQRSFLDEATSHDCGTWIATRCVHIRHWRTPVQHIMLLKFYQERAFYCNEENDLLSFLNEKKPADFLGLLFLGYDNSTHSHPSIHPCTHSLHVCLSQVAQGTGRQPPFVFYSLQHEPLYHPWAWQVSFEIRCLLPWTTPAEAEYSSRNVSVL